ncbi:precorrin-4 C(11)-methyltransferase [Alkaliphilus pronyensis]|uniref:Precorrin-4 C(11)-methyltransferase n=1 Tax=Alkaliphilus pronyensis TaxID=1482732 RepID=A0A6I0FIJ0_9FIRM|nr:precorrin-4 C(11)-methyltransferase [Alkaliphilus pronyensis]KAB3539056.1 precorrin-4 C(11)-methyltransferase [Alkaliphilus pronyensis]
MTYKNQKPSNKIFFIGAGPGDPELITIKGKNRIEEADVIVYAGSLVNPKVLQWAKKDSQIFNSATMDLDEIIEVMEKAVKKGKKVVRVHTGDPSIYGAIREQMDRLEELEIDFEVIPGVSSFLASAALLKKEFTLPDVSQTIICTRLEGRTPVPEGEALEALASHKASMAIFLSVHMIDKVVEKLMQHYNGDTPIAVVQRATWEDQRIVQGTLKDIASKVKKANITKTAQILVGDFLGNSYSLSKLYDKTFSHQYRRAKK